MSLTFNLGLFIIALLVVGGMIAHKIWLFKKGKIPAGSYEEADWTDLELESVRTRILELIKISVHRIALATLKAWIMTAHFIKRGDRNVRQRLINFLKKNSHYNKKTDQKPSDFISEIKVHHEEVIKNINPDDLQ